MLHQPPTRSISVTKINGINLAIMFNTPGTKHFVMSPVFMFTCYLIATFHILVPIKMIEVEICCCMYGSTSTITSLV